MYLPNSYQLVEFIIVYITKKNINYLQYSTIHKLHENKEYTIYLQRVL